MVRPWFVFLLLLGAPLLAMGGPGGPPAGASLSPDDVILATNSVTKNAGKTFVLSSATVNNLRVSTVNATTAILINGQPLSTQTATGYSIYPATGSNASFPLGVSASTLTASDLKASSGTATLTNLSATGAAIGTMTVTKINAGTISGNNSGDVTLSNPTGLSISGQAISLATATATSTGSLKSSDWSTFNGKLSPTGDGSGLTGLTKSQVGLSNVANVDQRNATNISSGMITDGARLASGTANSTTYLEGDLRWKVLNSTAVGLGNVTNDEQVKVTDYSQKGAVLVGISTNNFAVLGPGTDGQILESRNSAPTGLNWTTSPLAFTVYPATGSGASFPKGVSVSTMVVGTYVKWPNGTVQVSSPPVASVAAGLGLQTSTTSGNVTVTLAPDATSYIHNGTALQSATANISSVTASHFNVVTATGNRAAMIDGNNEVAASTTTSTELSMITGVTTNVQTQINNILTANATAFILNSTAATSGTFNVTSGTVRQNLAVGSISSTGTWTLNNATISFSGGVFSGTRTDFSTATHTGAQTFATMTVVSLNPLAVKWTDGRIQQFSGPVFNVLDYGIKNNGVMDISTTATSLINSTMTSGGNVVFPPGDYYVGASRGVQINVSSINVIMAAGARFLAGPVQVLTVNNVAFSTITNVGLFGIRITNSVTGSPNAGILIGPDGNQAVNNLHISDFVIDGMGQYGITGGAIMNHWIIENGYVLNNGDPTGCWGGQAYDVLPGPDRTVTSYAKDFTMSNVYLEQTGTPACSPETDAAKIQNIDGVKLSNITFKGGGSNVVTGAAAVLSLNSNMSASDLHIVGPASTGLIASTSVSTTSVNSIHHVTFTAPIFGNYVFMGVTPATNLTFDDIEADGAFQAQGGAVNTNVRVKNSRFDSFSFLSSTCNSCSVENVDSIGAIQLYGNNNLIIKNTSRKSGADSYYILGSSNLVMGNASLDSGAYGYRIEGSSNNVLLNATINPASGGYVIGFGSNNVVGPNYGNNSISDSGFNTTSFDYNLSRSSAAASYLSISSTSYDSLTKSSASVSYMAVSTMTTSSFTFNGGGGDALGARYQSGTEGQGMVVMNTNPGGYGSGIRLVSRTNAGVEVPAGQLQTTGIDAWSGTPTETSAVSLKAVYKSTMTTIISGRGDKGAAILGVSDASDASAGNYGEYITSATATGGGLVATSAVYADMISTFTLSAGDWEIRAGVIWSANGATFTSTQMEACIGTSPGNSVAGCSDGQNYFYVSGAVPTTFTHEDIVLPPYRVSISGSTNYYFKVYTATFTSGHPITRGSMTARRIR